MLTTPGPPAPQEFGSRDRLPRGFLFRRGSLVLHLLDQAFVVVIEVRRRRIDLHGPQVWVLAEDLFRGPAVVVMLACEMDHLAAVTPR